MAHSNQARKRIRQNEKRRLRNRKVLGDYRTAVTAAKEAIEAGGENVAALVKLAEAALARAAQKGALRTQTAARRTSRLVQAFKRS
ncbi:MAG: 30S ribosomal protein S20 [Myxococcota bacterium]|nr:30S ribosomal protein S20 [Myxococcota bacterium]